MDPAAISNNSTSLLLSSAPVGGENFCCEIEVIDKHCFLLRNLLSLDEQIKLFTFIDCRDKTVEYDMASKGCCMDPSPKTLIFGRDEEGTNIPHQIFDIQKKSIVNDLIISRGNNVLLRKNHQLMSSTTDLSSFVGNNNTSSSACSTTISMAVIKYMSGESNSSKFPRHIDHCDGSYVYLTSLGCTARFLLKGPNMVEKRILKMRSGDVLIFDASTAAAIEHGVEGIDGSATCPVALGEKCPVLQNHRYGVQCRVRTTCTTC